MQEMPVTPGWSNHVTKQGKEVQRSLYSSITPHELMGATGEADRLTWPEVAHYLMQTTTELADLLGISRSRGTHKG